MASSKVIEGLHTTVASATVFYQKLRAFHWTVKGPHFFQLHEQFEELYTRWAEVIDELAERAVQLGGTPPLTLAAVLKGAKLAEAEGMPDACGMVKAVIADLRAQRDALRTLITTAEEHGDRTTANVIDGIVDETEKTIWMLSAFNAG